MNEFDNWRLEVGFEEGGPLDILCAPEDHECENETCVENGQMCTQCRLPVCRECSEDLHGASEAKMPRACLANDLMTFYAPPELYLWSVTTVELICASVLDIYDMFLLGTEI